MQDGILVVFPSNFMLQTFIKQLNLIKQLTNLTSSKLLFIQSQDGVEEDFVVDNFKIAVQIGRGGVFFCTQSKFLDQFDFSS